MNLGITIFIIAAASLVSCSTTKQKTSQSDVALSIAKRYGCMACHSVDKKIVGPSFNAIASKYRGQDVQQRLFRKVKSGGAGVWGTMPMPAITSIPDDSLQILIQWITGVSPIALAETIAPPKIIVAQNGKVTNVSSEGNLASYQAVGCIPLAEAKNTFTPADIHKGVRQCVEQGNYDFAARLYLLAFMYGIFDAERITDKTAGQAILVLNTNTFLNVPQDRKIKTDEAIRHITKDSELLGKLCSEINKIGPPDYYPSYMILHGVKAFTGNPHDGALLKDFDTLGVWKKVQYRNLKCPV
jgi:cytochrome c551/c552